MNTHNNFKKTLFVMTNLTTGPLYGRGNFSSGVYRSTALQVPIIPQTWGL